MGMESLKLVGNAGLSTMQASVHPTVGKRGLALFIRHGRACPNRLRLPIDERKETIRVEENAEAA
jgi:hypothetical protein